MVLMAKFYSVPCIHCVPGPSSMQRGSIAGLQCPMAKQPMNVQLVKNTMARFVFLVEFTWDIGSLLQKALLHGIVVCGWERPRTAMLRVSLEKLSLICTRNYFCKTRLAHGLIKGQFRCFAFARLSQTNLNNLFFKILCLSTNKHIQIKDR